MKLKGRGPKGDEPGKLASGPKLDKCTAAVGRIAGRCWNELASERALGFGAIGNIPARAIDWWCRREGLDPHASRMVATIIRCMDADRVEREEAKRRLNK